MYIVVMWYKINISMYFYTYFYSFLLFVFIFLIFFIVKRHEQVVDLAL